MYIDWVCLHISYCLHRASSDGGLGELLKLEPIKESSLSPPPSVKATPIATSTAMTTSSLPSNTTTYPALEREQVAVKRGRHGCTIKQSPEAVKGDIHVRAVTGTTGGSTLTVKSPTGALAGQLSRNLSIKSPESRLSALPQHMQAVGGVTAKGKGAGSKVCKTSSLLTSAMRFHSSNDGLNSILDGSPDPIPGTGAVHTCILSRVHVHLHMH